MKALKITGIVVAAIVVLVAGAIAYLASQFDAARIRTEASRYVQETRQRTLSIEGDVKLAFWPNVAVTLGKVALSEHGSEQAFASLDSARVSVAVMPLLSRQLVVSGVEVNGMKAALVRRKDGTLNIADLVAGPDKAVAQAGKESQAPPLQLDIAGVKIANAQLGWRDEQTGTSTTLTGLDLATGRLQADTGRKTVSVDGLSLTMKGRSEGKAGADVFEIKLEAPRLAVTPEKSDAGSMTLSATLAGPQRNIVARLALADIQGGASAWKIGKLALDLDAKTGEAGAKGRIESALAADLDRQTVALEKIAGNIDISHPQMPMKQVRLPLSGALHADLAKQSADGNLSTQFDESKIVLRFGVTKFSPLALSFDLDVDRLNADRYLPPKKAEENRRAEKKPEGDGRLDFSALKALNLNGTVKVAQLQVANVKASKLRLQLRAAGGRLDVAPIAASLYDGTASGALSLDAGGNAVALKQNLSGIRIDSLLKDAVNRDMLEGRGNLTIDVATRGETVAAMKKALAGSAAISLRDGAIKGINLAQSFRDLKSKFSSRQDAQQPAKTSDKTDFTEMSASFRIAGGVARNDDFSAKSPFLRLSGSGDIDIGAGQLNYLAKASVVAAAGGQGAKDLDHFKGLTVPVRLTGPFDNPSWKIEFAGLAADAVKAKVEGKRQEIEQKAQEQVKDRLKGLFGR